MPVFAYTAVDRQGQQSAGSVPAESRTAALDQLLGKGLSPLSVAEQTDTGSVAATSVSGRVSASAVEAFTRELANLLAAGLPLSRSLGLLRREASNPAARAVWSAIHDQVVSGQPLADSLAQWPKAFPPVYVAMVRAGEAGGFLHVVLQQIADFRTREQDLKGKVKAAMIYPCILAVFAFGVVVLLMTFFIPRFSGIFAQFGGQLPWLTQVIVAISKSLLKYGPVVAIVVAVAIFLARRAARTDAGRRTFERAVLRLPLVGVVVARFALVRFCRMLGTLVGAGVSLVTALRVAREAIGNQTLADAVTHAIEQVQQGAPLGRSLGTSAQLFPPSVVEMITIAEETARLDTELVRISAAYESDLDRRLRMLVALAEPALLLVMAGLIGTIVVGMLLPVFNLQELIH